MSNLVPTDREVAEAAQVVCRATCFMSCGRKGPVMLSPAAAVQAAINVGWAWRERVGVRKRHALLCNVCVAGLSAGTKVMAP